MLCKYIFNSGHYAGKAHYFRYTEELPLAFNFVRLSDNWLSHSLSKIESAAFTGCIRYPVNPLIVPNIFLPDNPRLFIEFALDCSEDRLTIFNLSSWCLPETFKCSTGLTSLSKPNIPTCRNYSSNSLIELSNHGINPFKGVKRF